MQTFTSFSSIKGIIQEQSSNCLVHKLFNFIFTTKEDISIISEANTGNEDNQKLILWNNLFCRYKIEEKYIFNDKTSCINIIINSDINYTRRIYLENNKTPCIVIQVQKGQHKSLIIVGFYRQWRWLHDQIPNPTCQLPDQVMRFMYFREIIDNVAATRIQFIIEGDLNLDCNIDNNHIIVTI